MFRRANAENHLLIIIITFALTVLGVRGYLYLTGYPQIGTGQLHIAHMLWGGIALFVGSTMMLLYRGLYLSRVAAILTGVGWGLFIDEVGKFLTRSNDYFFAPAAVIIYVIFLLVTTVYVLYFREKKNGPRASDNEAFADVRELLDGVAAGELTHRERILLDMRLSQLMHDKERKYRDIGRSLKAFVDTQPVTIRQQRIENVGALVAELVKKAVDSRSFVVILVSIITIDVFVSITTLIGFGPFEGLLEGQTSLSIDSMVQLGSLLLRVALQILLIVGLVFAERGNIVLGRRMMIGSLLFMIIVLDSIDFYFGQFSTAYTVALDAFLLAMVEGRYGSDRIRLHLAEVSAR